MNLIKEVNNNMEYIKPKVTEVKVSQTRYAAKHTYCSGSN